MGKISELFARYGADTSGASAIEYALIAGMAAVVVGTVSGPFGTALSGLFTKVNNALNAAM